MSIETTKIGTRIIAVKGIGKMFYQDGFPITLSIENLKEKGIEVSLLHIADELLKHGWEPKTVINKLRNDAMEGIANEINTTDWTEIEKFCNATYEEQREMLFKYLFGCSTDDVRSRKNTTPLKWLRSITNGQ